MTWCDLLGKGEEGADAAAMSTKKPRLPLRRYAGGMQGVVQSYDPATKDGVVIGDVTLEEYDLAPDALDGSVFRMLRQGQRILFELDEKGFATTVRLGSEADMETPELLPE